MRSFYFFPLLIAFFVFSLCFRLNALFAQTTAETPDLATGMEILNQKIAAQKNQSLFPATGDDTEVVFDLTPDEQETFTHLEQNENAAYLADLYGAMRPKAAARILQQLDQQQTILILAHLPPHKAAAIIAEMPPQKAGALSLDLARYQSEQK